MPTDAPVLDYAPATSQSPPVVRVARWCWRYRQQLCGAVACVLACWIVVIAFNARIVLGSSIHDGRSQAWTGLYLSKWTLFMIAILWLGARRVRWSGRLARTSFAIAAMWWLYVQYMVHGGRGSWYW